MQIKEITDQQEWTTFFNTAGSPSFLHAWEWGDLQHNLHHDVLRLGMYDHNKLILIAQVLKMKTKRGNFLFIPHGPIIEKGRDLHAALKLLTEHLKHLAKKEKFACIRMSPIQELDEQYQKTFNDVGYQKAPIYMHAERMWVLPLEHKSTDTLLSEMRKTTRYCIKKAARDGVTIETRTDAQAVDDFWEIYQHTAEREHFTPFSKKFISEEFKAFHKTNNALFLFARLNSPESSKPEYLASALIIFTQSTGFYHQGASIHSKIPAPYLLQWEAIQQAQKRGCILYNFWGILQEGRTPKSWDGLTLFKQGFGGKQVDYLPTQDLIISPLYYLNYAYEHYLNWRRGV